MYVVICMLRQIEFNSDIHQLAMNWARICPYSGIGDKFSSDKGVL